MFVEMSPPFDAIEAGPFEPISSGWLTVGDLNSAASLAKGFYVVEVIFMAPMIAVCGFGLISSLFLHQAIASMPGRVAAIHFVLEHAIYTRGSTPCGGWP